MGDILDQSEVDALLQAVASGDDDIASAAQAVAAPASATEERRVSLYDFKRPERVSKDQMRALQSIHEAFARNLGATLSAFLRAIVESRVATIEQLTYSEFIHSLPSPTCFYLVTAAPLEGQICLELSPLIVYPIIDRLLGGTNAEIFIPQRPLTSIEQRLVDKLVNRALDHMAEAWADLVDVKFAISGRESNPHLVQIVAPNEVVVVLGFEIKIGARAGTMSLCIPFNVIEPVVGKLGTQSWLGYARGATSKDRKGPLSDNVTRVPVEARVYLGETNLTVGELLSLTPGDIIKLDKLADRDFIMQVKGQNKFAGSLGQLRGNRAYQVKRKCEPHETL